MAAHMTKILLLGLGRWGANHLRNLNNLPVELYVAEVGGAARIQRFVPNANAFR